MRRGLAAAAIVMVLLALPAASHAGVLHTVDFVSDTGFDPEVQRAMVGHVVNWDNQTGLAHTATSYEGVFDTGSVPSPGMSADVEPSVPGRYEYFCEFHPNMRGVLALRASGGASFAPDLDARPGYGNQSTAAYTLGGASVPVSPGLTLVDVDSPQIAGALVGIRGNFQAGDVLEFTDTTEIDGAYNANTGGLTLTGTASVAAYETALRTIRFRTSAAAGTKRVVFGADDDSGAHAPPDFRDIAVVSAPATNDPGAAGGGATPPPPGPNPITPPPPPLPADRVPDDARNRLSLRLTGTTFLVDAKGRATLRFTTEPGLRGTVDLGPAGRGTRFGRASFHAGARGAVSVRVRLSNRARRSLRRARRLRARLVLRSGTRTATRAVILRRRR